MKLRIVETAMRADGNPQIPGAIDALGIFDNLIQPVLPLPMQGLSIMLSFEEVAAPTMVEVRINSPKEELISKGNFGIMPDPFGFARKIINLEAMLLGERGTYTVDVFEVGADEQLTFIKSERLFALDYPPQRQFSEEEIKEILANDNLIKMVRTEFKPIKFADDEELEPVKLQISLDKNIPLAEGHIALPEDDMVEIKGEKFELTGLRRHIEWMFGQEIPQNEIVDEVKEEEKKNEESEKKEIKKIEKKETKKTEKKGDNKKEFSVKKTSKKKTTKAKTK